MRLLRIYYQSDKQRIPISEMCIHPDLLDTLAELGMLEIDNGYVEEQSLRRINKIMRLQGFLGVNLNGAIIIADLMERIESLEAEIRRLKETR